MKVRIFIWIPIKFPFRWRIFFGHSMYYSAPCKNKREIFSFLKNSATQTSQKSISVWVSVFLSVWCYIGVPALLTQRRDLKFSKNISNLPMSCLFHVFEISLKMRKIPLNEKNRFFRWDTFKRLKIGRNRLNVIKYVGIIFLLIGIANDWIPRILKYLNFGSKIAKNAKSTHFVLESQS